MGAWNVRGTGDGLAPTLDSLIVSMCLDYERRDAAIFGKTVCKRVDMEYRYLNFKMLDAAGELVGERYAPLFIKEIGMHVGYASSAVDYLSETVYKRRKREIKLNIARKLHLLD